VRLWRGRKRRRGDGRALHHAQREFDKVARDQILRAIAEAEIAEVQAAKDRAKTARLGVWHRWAELRGVRKSAKSWRRWAEKAA